MILKIDSIFEMTKRLNILLVLLGLTLGLHAQLSPVPPRLVVGIQVDGLQHRHLEQLWYRFDANGFRKLVGLGANMSQVHFNVISAGSAPDIATIMTGSTPYYHGITGNQFFNRTSSNVESILHDEYQDGVGTRNKFSSHFMLSSTFVDELMMANQGKSKAYVVAIDPEEAVLMGGHTANSAVWLDETKTKWVSSSYFKDGLPARVDSMNNSGFMEGMAKMKWTPFHSPKTYVANLQDIKDRKYDFEYKLSDKNLKKSPVANVLVAEMGLSLLESGGLGKDASPDVLMLQFTVKTPQEKTLTLRNMEKEDMYLRLDKELQSLTEKIEKAVGTDRVLFVLFGNQSNTHLPAELGENSIPSGYFNANRSMALLSSYLMAIYGPEKWIKGYYGKNIFLNKEKILEYKLNLRDFQQTVADFMVEFEGVQTAYTFNQLMNTGADNNNEMARLRNTIHKKTVGDVLFTLLPGWLELDDNLKAVGEMNEMISFTPLYFYGWRIQPETIRTNYQITDLAPTITRILNVPFPNANLGKPMTEILK